MADDPLTPLPPLTPDALGVRPPPAPPTPPTQGLPPEGRRKRRFAGIGAALAALIAGPGSGAGTGLVTGTLGSFRERDLEQLRADELAQQQFRLDAAEYQRQLREGEQDLDQRQRVVQNTIENLRRKVAGITNREDYDRAIQEQADVMQSFGFRGLGRDYWRRAARFVAPSKRKLAEAAFERVISDPLTKDVRENDPTRFLSGFVDVDLNDDGIPERISVLELAAEAGRRPVADERGRVLIPEQKHVFADRFEETLKNARRRFREQNDREPTADEDRRLIQEAQDASTAPSSEFLGFVGRREAELGRKLTSGEFEAARKRFRTTTDEPSSLVQRQARQALYGALLTGGSSLSRSVIRQVRAAGLDLQAELADIRRQLIAVGKQLDPYGDETDPDLLFERGRQALAGAPILDDEQTEAPPAAPADPAALERVRGAISGPVGSRQLTPGVRYRYEPGRGLVAVP